MVTLLAHAKAANERQAEEVLQMEIQRQNRTLSRATGQAPETIWRAQILDRSSRMRTCPPPALLDLHFSLRTSRRVNNDHTIDFEGRHYEIAATARKSVTIIHHPGRKCWVVENSPKPSGRSF